MVWKFSLEEEKGRDRRVRPGAVEGPHECRHLAGLLRDNSVDRHSVEFDSAFSDETRATKDLRFAPDGTLDGPSHWAPAVVAVAAVDVSVSKTWIHQTDWALGTTLLHLHPKFSHVEREYRRNLLRRLLQTRKCDGRTMDRSWAQTTREVHDIEHDRTDGRLEATKMVRDNEDGVVVDGGKKMVRGHDLQWERLGLQRKWEYVERWAV